MVFALAISLYFLTKKKTSLIDVILSAILCGYAFWVKEVGIFLVPGFIYLVYFKLAKHQRNLGTVLWTSFYAAVLLLYPFMALNKSELFPSGGVRVSLIETLRYQVSRGTKLPFWNMKSDFALAYSKWSLKDPVVMYFMVVNIFVAILIAFRYRNKYQISFLIMLVGLFFFLMRGGVVLELYVIPLFPFAGMLFAMNLFLIRNEFKFKKLNFNVFNQFKFKKYIFGVIIFTLLINFYNTTVTGIQIYSYKENYNMKKSIDYIWENIDNDNNILIDFCLFMDLRNKQGNMDRYPNADYIVNVDTDPEIKVTKIKNSWKNIDYLIGSSELYRNANEENAPILKAALDNSFLVKDYQHEFLFPTLHDTRYFSVHGAWSSILKVNNNPDFLKKMWGNYNDKYISKDGRVIDDVTNDTTSKGQGMALLRAVWSEDKISYGKILDWTINNLQKRQEDKLFYSKLNDNGVQTNNSTDGDIDIATSLILANRQWKDQRYIDIAKPIINDIYEKRVIQLGDNLTLMPNDYNKEEKLLNIKPSYFSPAFYRLFAEVDKSHNWSKIADDTYNSLKLINENDILYPENVKYDVINNKYIKNIQGSDDNKFGYNNNNLILRIGFDYYWNNNQESLEVLNKLSKFFQNQGKNNTAKDVKDIKAVYNTDGTKYVEFGSASMDAMAAITFQLTDNPSFTNHWKDKILLSTNYLNGKYNNNENYYDQNMIWFAYGINYQKLKP